MRQFIWASVAFCLALKHMLSWLALVLLVVGAPPAKAQDDAREYRPAIVLSFAGHGELKHDLDYLGTLAGNPNLAARVEQLLLRFTQDEGLAGVDAARPWGASLSIAADGSSFSVLAFVPVTDLRKLLDALESTFGKASDVGDDVYEIERDTGSLFIKQKGKWAFVSRHKNALEDLPVDPLKQLRGLDEQYDLALRVNVQNIPQGVRDMAAGFIKQGLAAGLQHGLDDDDEEQNDLQARVARSKADQMVKRINELDRLTVGLNIDRSTCRTYLDLEVTALPDSDTAKRMAAGSEQPADSRLAGVWMPDAIFSLHVNSPLSLADEQQAGTRLNSFRRQVLAKIGNAVEIDEQKAKVKELVGKLLDLLDETIKKEGRINFGLVVNGVRSEDELGDIVNDAIEDVFPNRIHENIIGAGQVTVVAGGLTADGAAGEDATMQIAAMVAEDNGQNQPKLNVDKYKERRFHTFTVMAPQTMRAELPLRTLRNLLGNPLKIVLAFGDDTFYAAVGEKGADAIKRVIDKSAEAPAEKLPPATASLSLASAWRLIIPPNRNSKAAKISDSLGKGGKDHLKLTVEPVAGGVRYRVEGEEGFNMLLGVSLSSAVRVVAASQ
jgi:hypothetical protein